MGILFLVWIGIWIYCGALAIKERNWLGLFFSVFFCSLLLIPLIGK